MAIKKHDSTALQAMKALVAIYGPREAARVSGIPAGTVLYYAARHKWKKAALNRPANTVGTTGERDVADVLVAALEKHKQESQLHLAEYTANASRKAAEHKDPLEVARKVRDVAGVFQVLYPPESETSLIEASILIGDAKPTLNVEEIEAARQTDYQIEDAKGQIIDVPSFAKASEGERPSSFAPDPAKLVEGATED